MYSTDKYLNQPVYTRIENIQKLITQIKLRVYL